jgi:2-oxo-4-hydroxy-4-carboxy-5-ureidoimidazoline decarboxylase
MTAAVPNAPLPEAPDIGMIDRVPATFAAASLAPLFEGAPSFLRRLVDARPFETWERLFTQARAIALAMPETEQIELVDAHPRLGAPAVSVSALSFREQGYHAEAAESAAEAERPAIDRELRELNEAYERQFGFRYCVFVAGRSRASLLPDFRAALDANRATELRRALVDVVRIAAARQQRLAEEANR